MDDIKILVVDSIKDDRDFIFQTLKNEGYSIFTASDGKTGVNKAKEISPLIIIMDVALPEIDGIEICKELRDIPECRNSGILFITSRTEDYTQIAALDAGADDYILKPVRPRVLISRIKSLIRRTQPHSKDTVNLGKDLIIDKSSRSVRIGKSEINLSKKEFDLLEFLISKPGKVYSRHDIHDKVWNDDLEINDRIIDVHIWKLRQKLGKKRIITLKGIGYKIELG
jgi:two-component system alkaline phosphatase synthesis response regulator PhoP